MIRTFFFLVSVASLFGRVFDTSDWTRSSIPSGSILAFGAGRFVLRLDGTNITSINGLDWQTNLVPAGGIIVVKFTGGRFLAGGGHDGGTEPSATYTTFGTSIDGLNWTFSTNSAQPFAGPVNTFCYGNGPYVARSEANHFFFSTDGTNWVDHGPQLPSQYGLGKLEFGNGVFVGLDAFSGQPFSSTDGVTWTPHEFTGLKEIVFGNGAFVAWSSGKSPKACSLDGANWMPIDYPESFGWVTFGNGRFFAITHGTTTTRSRLISSADGQVWQELSTHPEEGPVTSKIVAGNGRLIGVQYDSTDGVNFNYYLGTSPPFTTLRAEPISTGMSLTIFGVPTSTCTLKHAFNIGTPDKSQSVVIGDAGSTTTSVEGTSPIGLWWVQP